MPAEARTDHLQRVWRQILAAHFVCHWDDYVSDDVTIFRQRVAQLVTSIMKTDVSGNVLRKSESNLMNFKPLDTERLADEYHALLDLPGSAVRWDDLLASRPELYILATHLNTGTAGAFCRNGFTILPVGAGHRHEKMIRALGDIAQSASIKNQAITRAVAASSAFPPAFSPLPLVPGDSTHMLTDGGVYDNSGVNFLSHLYQTNVADASSRLVIVSDAGRDFSTELHGEYDTFMGLALRVTDAQGDRIAEADSLTAKRFFESQQISALFLSIHDQTTVVGIDDNHSDQVQARLRMIRTELDAFSAAEVFALYRHGFRVTCAALISKGLASGPVVDVPWTPVDSMTMNHRATPKAQLESALEASHQFKKQLRGTLVRLAARKVAKDYPLRIAGSAVAAIVLIAGLMYLAYIIGAPPAAMRVVPAGALPVVEVVVGDGWLRRVPSLSKLTESKKFNYSIATATIGSLTGDRAHAPGTISLSWGANDWSVDLFLEQCSSGECRIVALTQPGGDKTPVTLPSGEGSDRLLGLVVSNTDLENASLVIKEHLKIHLGAQ